MHAIIPAAGAGEGVAPPVTLATTGHVEVGYKPPPNGSGSDCVPEGQAVHEVCRLT